MASKPVSAVVFVLAVHVFAPSSRATRHLETPRTQIYTLYTFYTAIKEGFATTSIYIEIRVTNLWPNRLIGDDTLFADDCEWRGSVVKGVKEIGIVEIPQWVKEGKRSPTGRNTFTTWKHWDKNDKPLPSGLLGPVSLKTAASRR